MAVFPIRQDRIGLGLILFIAFIAVPLFGSPFLMEAVMIPFLVLSLATIGLNLLTGYTGLNRSVPARSWEWGPTPASSSSTRSQA